MLISNRQFSGERPKRSERNIADNEATVALDCELVSDELRALHAPLTEAVISIPNPGTIRFFQGQWFAFADQLDMFEFGDRLFWTGPEGARQANFTQLQLGESSAMGVPQPDDPTVNVSGTSTGGNITTSVIYTFVNQYGEEGDSSVATDTFTVGEGQTINYSSINGFDIPNQNAIQDHGLVATRIYRLAAGAFKFVAEVPVGDLTFTEVFDPADPLGESFSTDNFDVPPVGLTGLHLMANGVAIGFISQGEYNVVYATEVGQPNAWANFFPVRDMPIALSSYDNYAVILTDGYPEVAVINDPSNIIPTRLNYSEPCQSKLGVVQAQGGVIYPSINGIFYVGRGGGENLTKDYLDRRDWARYNPSSMVAGYKDGQYIGFHQGQKEGSAVVLDTREPNAVLRQLSQAAQAVFVLPGTDDLYFAEARNIRLMEGSDDLLEYYWQSKMHGDGSPFALSSKRMLSCEQVDFDYDPDAAAVTLAARIVERAQLIASRIGLDQIHGMGGALNQNTFAGCGPFDIPGGPAGQDLGAVFGGGAEGALFMPQPLSVQFILYGDKTIVHDQLIGDDDPSRLDYFTRRRYYQYALRGKVNVQQIDIAGSISEMHSGN